MTTFSPVLPYWQRTEQPWSFDSILNKEEQPFDFQLRDRDLDILQACLEHRFLTTLQLHELYFTEGNGGLRYTQRRMKLLYEIGLLMKTRPRTGEPGSKPNIFALTRLGFDLLVQLDCIDREEGSLVYYSEEDNIISFDYMIHDLHLNELCIQIFKEAKARNLSFEWLPTKLCRQQIRMPGGKERKVEPDAVFLFYQGNEQIALHIEYERAANPRRFREKMTRWKVYRKQQAWKEKYQAEPFILVIGDREGWETGGRKHRVVRSIQPLVNMAYQEGFRKIAFLPTDEVEDGTWNCLPFPDNSETLWDLLQLR